MVKDDYVHNCFIIYIMNILKNIYLIYNLSWSKYVKNSFSLVGGQKKIQLDFHR